jgi:hypothetical protein
MNNRTVGQFPISIASSLALEGSLAIHPDIEKPKLHLIEYESLWINIKTLFRNALGSLSKEDAVMVVPKDIANTIFEEMSIIEDIVKEKTNGKVSVVFYYSNYKNLEKHFKIASIRMDNTEKQKEYTNIQNHTLKILFDKETKEPTHLIKGFELYIKNDNPKKTLIITHYPIDLLSYKEFSMLALLESHTGKVLKQAEWYKKFYEGKELVRIPFIPLFLQVFGDKETFRPLQIQVRKDILEMANKYNFSSITTYDKVRYAIENGIKNEYSKELLLNALEKW